MRLVAVLTIAASLVLAGCGSNDPNPDVSAELRGDISMIEISRGETLAPSLAFEPGLVYSRDQTSVIWQGEGNSLLDGQPLLLDIYAVSLEDGSVLTNTFDGLPRSFLLAPELLGHDLYDALLGQRVGARILHVTPPLVDEADETSRQLAPPIATVIDIRPVGASGPPLAPRDDMPIVIIGAQGEPQITVREGIEPPTELQVAKLIQGNGPQVEPGAFVVAQFKAVLWEDGSLYASSWPVEMAPLEVQIGVGAALPGLDQGLMDQTEGSQILLVMPPSYAYPDQGTLVFVVDLLDVWNPGQ